MIRLGGPVFLSETDKAAGDCTKECMGSANT